MASPLADLYSQPEQNPLADLNPPEPSIRSRSAADLPSIFGNEFTKGLRRGALGVKGTAQGYAAQIAEPF